MTTDPLTCSTCDWTEPSTGDALTDSMLRSAHAAEHDDEATTRRNAAGTAAWYGED
jgi:hypothetical protein